MRNTFLACVAVASFAFVRFEANANAAADPASELTAKYCVSCHNQRLKTANLALDTADVDFVARSPETWEKVVLKLRARAMPPPGRPRPDEATYDRVAEWLESELDRGAAARPNPGRPSSIHRLNRTEYANAVRDLFGIPIDGASLLPADEQAHGFDTNADALSIPPALMDRYLTAAAQIARLAVGDPTIRPAAERYTAVRNNSNERTWLWQTERLGEQFPLGSRGGIAARHYFPVDGEYVLKVRLDRTWEGRIRGLNVPNHIEVRVDGVRVGQFTIGGADFGRTGAADAGTILQTADESLQVRVAMKAGLRDVVATIVKADALKAEGLGPARMPIWSLRYDNVNAQLIISSLLIEGPYDAQVPEDSPSRRRIFTCRPRNSGEELNCATKILSSLARRAYRRPPTSEDIRTLVGFYRNERGNGDFETGVRAALERLLVSPDFLFRMEFDPERVDPGTAYRLSDLELASRLSFFLWSSIPDDELLDLAIAGKLQDPTIFDRQVRRMLSDPRARAALVTNFFGQWLQIRNVWLLTPDTNRKYPWFDDNLRSAFATELELFLEAQLSEDRSVLDLLTAKDTFVNEQLARHYGIPNVYGSHFRRVTLDDENRWGLLGKAGVLAITSYPHRTSPTIRGKWLLENILAAPVPPPPPDVNTNLEDNQPSRPTAVREMLESHRRNPVCASCHSRMDPLGFSLENFDAIGQWRTEDGQAPIDAAGVLLDGTTIQGPADLGRALVEQKALLMRAIVEKLLTFAVGRQIEYYDAPAIRAIVRAAASNEYRWSSTILAVVKSKPFQFRRSAT